MSILLKNLHGNIGNMLWRIACGEYYKMMHSMDEMVLLIKSDLDYERFQSVREWMGWEHYTVVRHPPKDIEFREFRKQLQVNTQYVPLPDIQPGENFWMSGANESPLFFDNDRLYVHGLFHSGNPHIDGIYKEARRLYPDIDWEHTVSINVRRGDKLKLQDKYVIPTPKFFKQAMALFPDCHFLVTSDDMEYCRRVFVPMGNCTLAKRASAIYPKWLMDLYIQTWCRHNIISNSTFSWWGAYLNVHADRRVIFTQPWYKHRTAEQTDSIPGNDGWQAI